MRAGGHAAALAAVWLTLATASQAEQRTRESAVDADALAEHRLSCRHFGNRARFKSRDGGVEYVVVLADSCVAALHAIERREPVSDDLKASSLEYLERITALRRVIVGINVARAFGGTSATFGVQRPHAVRIASEPPRPVSATGEYLIARALGLQTAFRKWIASGARFELAER